jgi:hypothetical protein
MNLSQDEEFYKNKALKYKMKYLFLKQKMFGGAKPAWFDKFNQELIDFFPSGNEFILSGSGALVTLLNYFDKFDLLDNNLLDIPADFDIIYVDGLTVFSPVRSFGQGKFIKRGSNLTRSSIFDYKVPDASDPDYVNLKKIYDDILIKKLDLTRISDMNIDYISVKNPEQQELFKVISPKTLLKLYVENYEVKNENKIKILKELIKYLEQNSINYQVITIKKPQKIKNEKLSLPSAAALLPAQPAVSTELEFSDVESPLRPSKPAARKIPLPSLDVNSDDEFESPKRLKTPKPTVQKSLSYDDD